jgi:hypothetical protein
MSFRGGDNTKKKKKMRAKKRREEKTYSLGIWQVVHEEHCQRGAKNKVRSGEREVEHKSVLEILQEVGIFKDFVLAD